MPTSGRGALTRNMINHWQSRCDEYGAVPGYCYIPNRSPGRHRRSGGRNPGSSRVRTSPAVVV
jgi:hypothetical protein